MQVIRVILFEKKWRDQKEHSNFKKEADFWHTEEISKLFPFLKIYSGPLKLTSPIKKPYYFTNNSRILNLVFIMYKKTIEYLWKESLDSSLKMEDATEIKSEHRQIGEIKLIQ